MFDVRLRIRVSAPGVDERGDFHLVTYIKVPVPLEPGWSFGIPIKLDGGKPELHMFEVQEIVWNAGRARYRAETELELDDVNKAKALLRWLAEDPEGSQLDWEPETDGDGFILGPEGFGGQDTQRLDSYLKRLAERSGETEAELQTG